MLIASAIVTDAMQLPLLVEKIYVEEKTLSQSEASRVSAPLPSLEQRPLQASGFERFGLHTVTPW